MKLQLSENIRQMRRHRGLSQEQLAEMLGVSSQSVSRWETAATYPDMELLPLLAHIFDCTTDSLLGVPAILAETKKDSYYRELEKYPIGDRERISILRRACTEFPYDWKFTHTLCVEMMSDKNNYPEVCKIAKNALEKCTDGYWRAVLTRIIVQVMDDENVFDFIERNTTFVDMRSDILLTWRYLTQENYDLYMAMTQKNRIFALNQIFGGPVFDSSELAGENPPVTPDHERRIRVLRANLAYFNAVAGIDEEKSCRTPIIGDGVPDMWFISRYRNGLSLVSRLAAIGKISDALDALEELTELFVRFFSMSEGTRLSFHIDAEGRLDSVISYHTDEKGGKNAVLTFINRVGFKPLGEAEQMPVYRTRELLEAFETGANPFLDLLSGEPRYIACVEKMKSCSAQ